MFLNVFLYQYPHISMDMNLGKHQEFGEGQASKPGVLRSMGSQRSDMT